MAVSSWVAALVFGSKVLDPKAHESWQTLFLAGLRYDLFWSEIGTLSAVAITFGLMPAVGLAAYFSSFIRRVLGFPSSPGITAHRMFSIILAVGPFALLAGGLVFWITFITGSSEASKAKSVLLVYSVSALRIGAILPLLLPFARIILDVVGDVIFHLQPSNSPLSSQAHTLPRLKTLLKRLSGERETNQIMVIAHSQGSVIAWTALCEPATTTDILVTIGSPLTTLYACLLGGEYGKCAPTGAVEWRNLFRDGDYIGGAVAGCPTNRMVGPGGHTGYWSDPRLIEHLSA